MSFGSRVGGETAMIQTFTNANVGKASPLAANAAGSSLFECSANSMNTSSRPFKSAVGDMEFHKSHLLSMVVMLGDGHGTLVTL